MLLDPAGRVITSQKREIVTSNPDIARFASMAETPFRVLDLTVVCLRCKETPRMANATGDAQWKMECGCTTRVLTHTAGVQAN